jgi:hypothetical protein
VFAVRRWAHYLHTVADGEGLPSLNERLAPLCRERIRRIDRFIQLALLGSAECVADESLSAGCGLYVCSGLGPLGNNIVVQHSLVRDHKVPMPFNFVNTLGSSAGYYVARNLGLDSQSLFVSRRGDSLGAGLTCAAADVASGAVSQVLIGAVEECTLPVEEHRARQGLPPETAVAEGSHWLLLDWVAGEQAPGDLCSTDDAAVVFHDSRAAGLITAYLDRASAGRYGLAADKGGWALHRLTR